MTESTTKVFGYSTAIVLYLIFAVSILTSSSPVIVDDFKQIQSAFRATQVQISLDTPIGEVAPDTLKQHREMLLPTVKIRTNNSVGSGVVIRSIENPDGTYTNVVLTAKHVVLEQGFETPTPADDILHSSLRISCYWNDYGDMITLPGTATAVGTVDDIAIVVLDYDDKMPYVAKLMPTNRAVKAFQEVFAIGCTLGIVPPSPSEGIISIPYADRAPQEVVGLATAPVAGGNSGGGLYGRFDGDDRWYLIGIITSTSVDYGHSARGELVQIPYSTHAWYAPDIVIRPFLAEQGY